MKKIEDDSILNIIKKEEKLLTVDYNYALKKNRGEFIIMIITEILDKIYLIRSIWLIKKYEMFTLNLSLYLLWHMIILFFVCFFYNNTVLHKIWIMDNYPDLKFYIIYGLISILIAYGVHRLLTYLIANDIRIEKMKRIPKDNDDEIRYKYTCLICCSIAKIIIFYILLFIFIIFFTGYLFIFSGIFPATIKKILESYGIALVIITIIKIFYGLILGILRKISLSYEIKLLYNIIRFLDIYIS